MKTFEELGLSRGFVSMLEGVGITTPSEIQEKAIPLVLAGKDVVGGSATGSGKTLAFSSGIIEKLEKDGNVQALVLTPTRELAEQVAGAIADFSKHRELKVLSIYGGVNINDQIRKLGKTDIVVGTPGRVLDHLSRGSLKLGEVKFLVLDEMDRMFDMGFQEDVEKILSQCPKQRQTMLFSATVSSEIDHLVKKHTKDSVEVAIKAHVDASKLKQIYYDVPDGMKFSLFVHLLKKEKSDLVMVFCGTRRNVDFVTTNLNNQGIKAKAIHGGMVQKKRSRVMEEFNREGGVNVLVCTDVAARGLDIGGVSHVYNYDLPKTSADYIHRIGRTARAGKEGIAISVLCSRDYENFRTILKDEKLKIEAVKTPYIQKVRIIVNSPRGRFGNRGNFSRGVRGDNRGGFKGGNSGRFGRERRGFKGRGSGKGFGGGSRGGSGGFKGRDSGRGNSGGFKGRDSGRGNSGGRRFGGNKREGGARKEGSRNFGRRDRRKK